ncbi:hypothetical protein [Marinoscillum pacificum]|uniref:hypothetical protein n=1 Tax=Marinoscillum pacificum TaxID=392723 RepID=UPI002157A076|nr:hypothetical protein [Marinoscillum pacificum]
MKKNTLNRRDFAIKSAMGLAGIGMADASQAQLKEEQAIIAVLEKESATWRAGDKEGHAACWQARPYSKILITTKDGQFLDIPVEVMLNPSPEIFGKGGRAENSDYRFSINGKSAWVSHKEVSYSPDGSSQESYEIRMLEKIKGQWKLVGQSIHIIG